MSAPWTKETLGNIATLQRGFDLPSRLRRRGTVPIVTSSGIEGTHCDAKVKGPGVVTGRYGTIGEVFFVACDFWPLNTTLYVRDFHGNDPVFLSYLLRTIDFHSHSGKTGVPGVNRNDLHEIVLSLPPIKAEQEAIAAALSDADALINSLEQLLAKKRQIKQGAMQELLTGRKRLPGFSGEWEPSTLKQVAEIGTGINKPISEMGSGTLYVTVQDFYDGTSIRTERLGRIEVSSAEILAKTLEVGDIVFGKSSVKRAGIGYPSQFLGAGEPVVFSGFTYCARARDGIADGAFLFYSLRSSTTRRWVIENSQASALTNINQRIADAIPVDLPPLPEQSAIAAILSDVDEEVAEVESKLSKARQLKQGMMHQLLTGRIRLV
ncbi:MAG: restriction endonuclease subunit S [Acidobacteriota bacterium]